MKIGNYCVSIEAPFHFETLLSLIYSLIYFGTAEKKIYFHNMKQRYKTLQNNMLWSDTFKFKNILKA